MNQELSDVQAEFRKVRGTRDQIANICWIIKKAKEFQKDIYFCFIDDVKAFECVDHNKLGKFFQRWEYQTTLPASWEINMQVKKQQLELDMKQWAGFKLGKEYVKAVYRHPAYLTYIQTEVKWSRSVVSDSLRPHGMWPNRFLHPWDSPGKNPGVGCHFLLQGNLPKLGIEPRSPVLQADALISEPPGKPMYIQTISCEMLGWMQHKLESRLWEKC